MELRQLTMTNLLGLDLDFAYCNPELANQPAQGPAGDSCAQPSGCAVSLVKAAGKRAIADRR
jgi:hypothetical protein